MYSPCPNENESKKDTVIFKKYMKSFDNVMSNEKRK